MTPRPDPVVVLSWSLALVLCVAVWWGVYRLFVLAVTR